MSFDHETSEFTAYNVNDRLVSVTVRFNIDREDIEVYMDEKYYFKKAYAIELVEVVAYDCETQEEYSPTKEDLDEWRYEIKSSLEKEFIRQTA